MKQGKTLTELAMELDRQASAKKDFIAPATKLTAAVELEGGARVPTIALQGQGQYPLTTHAHGQVSAYTEIPKAYYDRMLTEAPALWATNVNEWFGRSGGSRMVRTLDDSIRALLSDRFRALENFDLAQAVLPELMKLGLDVKSCDITERKMYIKAVDPHKEESIARAMEEKGLVMDGRSNNIIDVVSPAITISNSEVGAGTLFIGASMFVKACTNLCVWAGGEMKRYHVGKRQEVSEEVYAMLTDQTRATMDEAIWLQARDVTASAFDGDAFAKRVEVANRAAGMPIEGEVVEVVAAAAKQFSFTGDESGSVLDHLIRGGDLSQWGLHNAVTRTAQDVDSYDRASELERIGGTIIELPQRDWERLAA